MDAQQFNYDTRHRRLTRIERQIARVKEAYGLAQLRDNSTLVQSFGRKLWQLEDERDLYKKWLRAYTQSRGL
jgi:hypothetical protein